MSTPPLFHVETDQLHADTVVLDGPEGRHAARVRRLTPGERVFLADGRGLRALCEVTAVDRDTVSCAVLERAEEARSRPWLVVVQALAKGDRAEQAIETMTEVGVDEIVPWQADRCVVRWRDDRVAKSTARWRTTAAAAAKQARRAWTPVVAEVAETADVARRVSAAALAVVLDAEGAPPTDLAVPADGEVVLVVGPEGGLTADEMGTLLDAGARCLRLGPTVLRSATAGTVAAATVLARSPRWA
ncbi:MAG: 16S rRNA (uracil(1498)-N(3))-methyltransferase [Streptosporangiales bacterium]|nr:16S rRNA (uracil(1498)-N(3))-methyltransferase [Streptosporangiales bacterium]